MPLKQWKLSPMDLESRRRFCIHHLLSQMRYVETEHEPIVRPSASGTTAAFVSRFPKSCSSPRSTRKLYVA